MYHFGINNHFKTENILSLNIIFYRLYNYINRSDIYLFIYFKFCFPRSVHILH